MIVLPLTKVYRRNFDISRGLIVTEAVEYGLFSFMRARDILIGAVLRLNFGAEAI